MSHILLLQSMQLLTKGYADIGGVPVINDLSQLMKEYFDNLTLRPPLFYLWKYGIRFEISMPWVQLEEKNNLQQIKDRSIGIFNRKRVIHVKLRLPIN